MKMLRVAGLLLTACFMSNVQSMEPVDQFPVEQEFASGKISVKDYLSYLASLSPEYRDQILAVRYGKFSFEFDRTPYQAFVDLVGEMSVEGQKALGRGNMKEYKNIVNVLRSAVLRALEGYFSMVQVVRKNKHKKMP